MDEVGKDVDKEVIGVKFDKEVDGEVGEQMGKAVGVVFEVVVEVGYVLGKDEYVDKDYRKRGKLPSGSCQESEKE